MQFAFRLTSMLLLALAGAAGAAHAATEIVIATVNNGHMIQMQRLTPHFERAHPDIRLKWVTLEEGVLRQRVATDIATQGGQFDVMTIGSYETQLWGGKGWLHALRPDAGYDVDDLLPAIRNGLTVDGQLYALPFYGESSMLMLRQDLADAAGVRLPERPTWRQVRDAAARLHDPDAGVNGICLRGKPGWGDNMALVSTMANSHGGQWFDMAWRPQLESRPWKEAVALYVELLQKYGPPGSTANSFNEILALYQRGRCAIWVDATVAAAFLDDPRQSQVAGRVAYTQAPAQVTAKGANWLWVWALAVPKGTRQPEAARRFVSWATSREYVALVAREQGWAAVPTGTRKSTYANPAFQKAARFAAAEQQALASVNPDDPTLPRSPYRGVQFVAIPEFQTIGTAVGQQLATAVVGKITVEQALKAAQAAAEREMRQAGYLK